MNKKEKNYTIGIDIGGTNMKAVLFDTENKKIISEYSLATPTDNLKHFLIMLNALLEPLIEKANEDKIKIKGIGLGVAGAINQDKKTIIKSPNIPILDGVKLSDEVEKKMGITVSMDNDANCFLLAEAKLGAAEKYNNAYGIIIGTGIGGAWWFNNKIYQGAHGTANEPGRMIVDFKNVIEIEKIFQKLSQNNPSQLAEEAYRGDSLAEKSFKEIGQYLGIAFANIVNLIDPEIIIIGGGVSEAIDLFLPQIKKGMQEYIMGDEAKKIKVVKSKLGKDAGTIGAALLV